VLGFEWVVLVAGGSGRVYRLDCDCDLWTPVDGGDRAVHAPDRDGSDVLTPGASGCIYERTPDGWDVLGTPMTADLYGAAFGESVDVAVGASGTILERPR
jgi:hypothetical protein